MVTLDNWQAQMREDMQLRDFSERTREAYELAMKLFLRWAECEPEALEEVQVKTYVLHLREKGRSPSSINIAVCGMRFFFTFTLPRDWGVFELLRVKHPSKLPIVLSTGEVRTPLASIRHPVRRMALTTIYALGLRLGEGLRLETSHIDGDRLFVAVRDGKGAKDRSVPLPRPPLARLRRYWKEERPKGPGSFLFVPARGESPLHEDAASFPTVNNLALVALGRESPRVHPIRLTNDETRPHGIDVRLGSYPFDDTRP